MKFTRSKKVTQESDAHSLIGLSEAQARALGARMGAMAAAQSLLGAQDNPASVEQLSPAHWRAFVLDHRLHVGAASEEIRRAFVDAFAAAADGTMKAAGQDKWKPVRSKTITSSRKARKGLEKAGFGHSPGAW